MNPKKVMLAVMCVLLTTVVLMMGIFIGRVGQLLDGFSGMGSLGGIPGNTKPNSTTAPTQTTPPTTQKPEGTRPPAVTKPTEPGHEHEYILEETVSATCDSLGYDIMICIGCGREDIQNFVDPHGHNYSPGQTISATCTDNGYTTSTCYNCGDVWNRNFQEAPGHDFQFVESVVPGCVVDGCDKYACSRCGEEQLENLVTAPGHTNVSIGDIVIPTCTTDGLTKYQCSTCGEITEEVIPASGHIFDDWYIDENGMNRACLNCPVVELVPTSELRITSVEPLQVQNGMQIVIVVGIESEPELLRYIIYDRLNNGTLTYELIGDRGLVITYQDSTGVTVELARGFTEPGMIIIDAG